MSDVVISRKTLLRIQYLVLKASVQCRCPTPDCECARDAAKEANVIVEDIAAGGADDAATKEKP